MLELISQVKHIKLPVLQFPMHNSCVAISGGLAQSVKASNSNYEVARSPLDITRFAVFLRKALNSITPTSGGADQWIKARICRLLGRLLNWAMNRCILGKDTLRLYSYNRTKQSIRRRGSV